MRGRKLLLAGFSLVAFMVVLTGAYIVLFGVQTYAVLHFRLQRQDPRLYVIPRQLPVPVAQKFRGKRFAYFGYEFEAPWADISKEQLRKSLAWISFKSGKAILLSNPAKGVDLLDEFDRKNPEQADKISAFFGPESVTSNHSFHRTILNATPTQLSIFMRKEEAVRLSFLLVLKGLLLTNAETGIYFFGHGGLKGFQFGDPARANKIVLDIYDNQDKMIEFTLFSSKDSGARLSQDEIFHFIQTLRPPVDAGRIRG